MFVVTAKEGQTIAIGDRSIRVLTVIHPGVVAIAVDTEADPVLLSWDRKLALFPEVVVTVARPPGFSQRVKLLFDAPKTVRIRELPHEPAD